VTSLISIAIALRGCSPTIKAAGLYVSDRDDVDEMNLRCYVGRENESHELIRNRRSVRTSLSLGMSEGA
jgi:hypothetical protein